MRVLLGLLKVLTGISLAIAILFFSGMYAVRYAMTRLVTIPERPVFPEESTLGETVVTETSGDNPDATTEAAQDSANAADQTSDPDSGSNDGAIETNTESPTAEDAPTEEDSPTEDEESAADDDDTLEPGAYRARVVQPIGLILRQGPDTSTIQLGGVAYNEELIVLSESSDGNWINVRLPGSNVEGWVKNGNTEPLIE